MVVFAILAALGLMVLSVVIFIAVGARPDYEDAPSALFPSIGGIMLLVFQAVIWIHLGATDFMGVA